MRVLVTMAAAAALWVQPANAAETIEGHFSSDIIVDRRLNFDADESFWVPSCSGQAACTYTDSYSWSRGGLIELSSEDGEIFTGVLEVGYSGLVNLEGRTYPYFTEGAYTLTLRRIVDAQFEIIDVQYSLGITSDHFSGNERLRSLVSVQFNAIPEPATWMMMLVGFGAIGWAQRRAKHLASCTTANL
ncbi:PEPxxWA-CTERM sorting domain-containing protein [Sphingomonas arenae]|uniref:PEPxxWA-CTERM sorting domain-containing protein n=1 Tax=Sphingomonas arenae TaxID=2812555 RepID=UPI0019674A77|nr:PEPxxWA-CTERM sorting domain-containing protein [Sphingomonas arenae]